MLKADENVTMRGLTPSHMNAGTLDRTLIVKGEWDAAEVWFQSRGK